MGAGAIGHQADGLSEMVGGFGEFPLRGEKASEVGMSGGGAGVKLERLVVLFDGERSLVLMFESDAEVDVSWRKGGVEANRSEIRIDGGLEFLLGGEGQPQAVHRFGMIRLAAEGFRERGLSFGGLAESGEGISEVEIKRREVGQQAGGLAPLLDGVFEVAGIGEQFGKTFVEFPVVRGSANGELVGIGGIGEAVLLGEFCEAGEFLFDVVVAFDLIELIGKWRVGKAVLQIGPDAVAIPSCPREALSGSIR